MIKTILFSVICIICQVSVYAQTNNPIPERITPSGILVTLEESIIIQPSNNSDPKARINMLREIPDGSGRKAIIDLRGILWITNNDSHSPFLKIKDYSDNFIDAPGKGTGFGAFAFHPDYEDNGLLYTTHSESANSAEADFKPEAFDIIELQWVLTEWKNDDPSSATFSGTHRELIRAEFPSALHGFQDLQFNPTVDSEDEDFGLLYLCIGDGGSSLHFKSENLNEKSSFLGSIFRIDPLGNNSTNGKYGIPASNPFFDDEEATQELFAYGFRNPHRISWDSEGDHTMFIGDIGEKNIEELNIGIAGANYGWDKREGTFKYDRPLGRDFVYDLPEDDSIYDYTYPVAQYDHDDGVAIVGGYVYRGNVIPELTGHYIFGDIPTGRLFHVPVEDLVLGGPLAKIKELRLLSEDGNATTLNKLSQSSRADLRFGIDDSGEIYFLTKADGIVRKFKAPTSSDHKTIAEKDEVNIFPNPSQGIITIQVSPTEIGQPYEILSIDGSIVKSGKFIDVNTQINLSEVPLGTYILSYGSVIKKAKEIVISE
ncbi:PQQ-dependent sugar dehydrogenase [Portibacter lacus]|uniref:T9SS C-terminal target domain-containing protein n=1 Tax=Portibacter lacus TaxID=1099794 RepID=A0AA37SK11_9BACT|nr:PQQ-dependent sugar dehydrogenase [Portibacter lacus]GLR15475.1 hypothetical protein GCM10007940_00900 [Portibacter lacus]